MFAYWTIFTFIVLISFLVFFRLSKIVKFYFFSFLVIVLILFSGLRTESNDYDGYREIFNQVPTLFNLSINWFISKSVNVEYGFIILSSFVKIFSNNIVLFMLIVSTLSLFLNSYVIWKTSPYVFLSLLLYFSHNFILKETIQIRQGLASAIILYAFYKHINKRLVNFLIILAGSIQASAFLVFIPIYFSYKKLSNKVYLLTFVFFLVFTFLYSGRHLFEGVLNLFGLPSSISGYLGWEEHDFKIGFFSPILIKQLFIFLILLYNRNKLQERYSHFNILLNFYFFSSIWYIYFNDFAIIAGRVSNLFSIGEVLLIPMVISICASRYRFYLYFSVIILAAVTLYLDLSSGLVFEYKNVFF